MTKAAFLVQMNEEDPTVAFIEDGGKIEVFHANKAEADRLATYFEANDITKVEDAIRGGYSYFSRNIGDYKTDVIREVISKLRRGTADKQRVSQLKKYRPVKKKK